MRAWAEDEPFAFDGKYNQLRYVNCWPKPIQRPHPPIYIPGGGSIETWDFCLDHDYNYSYLSFGGHKAGKLLKQALELNPNGIDPNYFYGEFLFEEGKYGEALKYLDKAATAAPRPGRESADKGRHAEINALTAKVKAKMG